MKHDSIVYKDLSYEINGILFDVHNELGRYCNEKQYGDLIEKKFKERKIKYEREFVIPCSFEGEKRGRNRSDFLVEDKIILEIKCIRFINKECYYQLQRYLTASCKKLGIIVNFRDKILKIKRVLNPNAKE